MTHRGGMLASIASAFKTVATALILSAGTNGLAAADNDIVYGEGDDYLNGGTGADYMEGGAARDTYVIDSEDDVVVEAAASDLPQLARLDGMAGMDAPAMQAMAADADIDTITSQISYALGKGSEDLVLAFCLKSRTECHARLADSNLRSKRRPGARHPAAKRRANGDWL